MKYLIASFAFVTTLLFTASGNAASYSCDMVEPPIDAPVISFTIGFNEGDLRFKYVQCILNRALKSIGYDSNLIGAPVGREIYDVVEGRADAIAATTIQSQWPLQVDNLIRLEDPFVTVTNIVFTRKGVPTPSSWAELANSGLQIVMARHHTSAQAYLAKANALDVEGLDQAVQVFLAGRADALVTFEANKEIQGREDLNTGYNSAAKELSVSYLYTYINEQYESLVPTMNEAIQAELKMHIWNLNE